MESIFALSPISSYRRVQKSSFTSLSTLANQNAARDGEHVSSHVNLPFEMVKRAKTLFPVVSRLSIKESINKIGHPCMAFRPANVYGQDFRVYHGCSMAIIEAVRLLDNSARFAKGSYRLSAPDPSKNKYVPKSRPQPPLVRPLRVRAESGKWARRTVEKINKTLINGHDRTESANSKTVNDIVHDFLGLELEMDSQGNIMPTFLPPLKSSKYDIYNRRRFNENLIFEIEK